MRGHKLNRYKRGDHLVVCDRTGKVIYASESRKEWTGNIVHRDEWESRHPMDFYRSIPDRQTAPQPIRVEPADDESLSPFLNGGNKMIAFGMTYSDSTVIGLGMTSNSSYIPPGTNFGNDVL